MEGIATPYEVARNAFTAARRKRGPAAFFTVARYKYRSGRGTGLSVLFMSFASLSTRDPSPVQKGANGP